MSNYKQSIARQLIALGNAVPSLGDEDLFTGVLDTCIGLVSVLSGNLQSIKLDANNLGDLASCLDGLQAQINKIANAAACTDRLRVGSEAVDRFNALQAQLQDLQDRDKKARTDLPGLQKQVQALEPTVGQLEQDYLMQESLLTALQAKAQTYSVQNRQQLQAQNDALLAQIATDKAKYDALQQNQDKHNADLTALQAKINAMPNEQQLVADYDRKAAELKRLQNAQVECSLAKQSELDNQISDLEKDVERLEKAMGELRKREQEVLSTKTTIETEKGIFETDFIQKLQEAMDTLKNNMASHMKTLNQLKDDADTLRKSIDECNSIRLNYSFMFDSLNDPLEAIAKVTEMDHEELKKYLDVNVSDHLEELKRNIKRDLGELGRIIENCRAAASTDQERLHYKIYQAK